MDYLREFKNDYRSLSEQKRARRVQIIKDKLAQLWAKSGDVSAYYRQVLTELRNNINAVLESSVATIRRIPVRLFLIFLVILMVASAFMCLSNYDLSNQGSSIGLNT